MVKPKEKPLPVNSWEAKSEARSSDTIKDKQ